MLLCFCAKSGAKVLLFFELTKKISIFFHFYAYLTVAFSTKDAAKAAYLAISSSDGMG